MKNKKNKNEKKKIKMITKYKDKNYKFRKKII